MRLHDRVFLLLGGTGGIGKALVEPLVRAGARVIIASRHPEKLEHREGVSLAHLDLAAPDLDQQLDRLGDAYPDIDGVIHCAGQNRFASLGNMAVSDLDAQIAVNLRSAMISPGILHQGLKKRARERWCSWVLPSAASVSPVTPPTAPASSVCGASPKHCAGSWPIPRSRSSMWHPRHRHGYESGGSERA